MPLGREGLCQRGHLLNCPTRLPSRGGGAVHTVSIFINGSLHSIDTVHRIGSPPHGDTAITDGSLL